MAPELKDKLPAFGDADIVTCSYCLTMIPPWKEALEAGRLCAVVGSVSTSAACEAASSVSLLAVLSPGTLRLALGAGAAVSSPGISEYPPNCGALVVCR